MRRDIAGAALLLFVAGASLLAGWLIGRESRDTIAAPTPIARPSAAPMIPAAIRDEVRRRRTEAAPSPAEDPAAPVAHAVPRAKWRVVVRDRDGSAVEGAKVRVWNDFGIDIASATVLLAPAATTDATGTTAIDVDVSGAGEILQTAIVAVSHAGHLDAEVRVLETHDNDAAIEVVLDRAVRVLGRCVDVRGAPLRAIQARAARRSDGADSDADGRFVIDGLPVGVPYVRFLPNGQPLAARVVLLPAARDGVIDVGDVVLVAGSALHGRYVDANGAPVAGARVVLICRELESGCVGATKSDVEGRFAFEHVGEGTIDVCVYRPDFPLDDAPGAAAYGVPVDGTEVVVRAPGDHYADVRMRDESGAKVGFFAGRIVWFALDDPSERVDYRGLGSGWSHFHVPVRPRAVYEMQFELDGFEPMTMRVTGTDERDRPVEAVLLRATHR
jgi:hypothetical protein